MAVAALSITAGKIFAVEKDPRRIEQIKANAKRFGVENLRAVQAALPGGLAACPAPPRIHRRRRPRAARHHRGRSLPAPGRHCGGEHGALEEPDAASETLRQLEFRTEIVQIQVLRGQDMPFSARLEALNPVWIITGSLEGQEKGEDGRGEAERERDDIERPKQSFRLPTFVFRLRASRPFLSAPGRGP